MLNLMARSGIEICANFTFSKVLRLAASTITISAFFLSVVFLAPKISFAQNSEPSQPEIQAEKQLEQQKSENKLNNEEKVETEAAPETDDTDSTTNMLLADQAKHQESGQEEIKLPEIMRDLSKLPFPVRRMHELILEAALSGDIEKLRPLVGFGADVTMLSLGGIEEDPLNFLKSLAGDDKGHEILAILVEVLESGYVHLDEGSEQELYVWPYFFAWPLDKLTPRQRVELYRLVTHGDYQDMESFGAYIFYRLGISPRGRWRFFVAGD